MTCEFLYNMDTVTYKVMPPYLPKYIMYQINYQIRGISDQQEGRTNHIFGL